MVTDAESAVSALVSEAGGGFHFSVKRAGPQNRNGGTCRKNHSVDSGVCSNFDVGIPETGIDVDF